MSALHPKADIQWSAAFGAANWSLSAAERVVGLRKSTVAATLCHRIWFI